MQANVGAGVLFRLMETATLTKAQESTVSELVSLFESIGVNFLSEDTLVVDTGTVRLIFRPTPNPDLYTKFVDAASNQGLGLLKGPDFNVALGTDGHRYWKFSLDSSLAVNRRTSLPKSITVDELQCVVYLKF